MFLTAQLWSSLRESNSNYILSHFLANRRAWSKGFLACIIVFQANVPCQARLEDATHGEIVNSAIRRLVFVQNIYATEI
jgi:long-subunit acyl-CoA synthetase (AMP-forming)